MKRALSLMTAAFAGLGLLSACAGTPPIARPAVPQSSEYAKAPLRAGDGSTFITEYTKKLQEALADDGKGLDEIQGGPMLDRTKAEILVAKAEKKKLGTVGFDKVVAGGPKQSEYPLWFFAFANADDADSGTQALLVTREDANSEWAVQQGLFIDPERVPNLALEDGQVAETGKQYAVDFGKTVTAVKDYLSGAGKSGGGDSLDDFDLSGNGFKGYRDYVDEYAKDTKSFKRVESRCQPYTEIDFEKFAAATESGGAVSMAEMRCTITLEVPDDFNFTLPKQVSAITTGKKSGNRVEIEASIPFLIETGKGKTKLTSPDWFPLSGKQTSAKGEGKSKSEDKGKDSSD